MGANICWKPLATRNDLDVSAPSSFIEAIREAFGEMPVELNDDSISTLRGMAAVAGPTDGEPYRNLIRFIEEVGAIEVWAEG